MDNEQLQVQQVEDVVNVYVRGVDKQLYRTLQHWSIDRNVPIGVLVNQALALWIGIESRIER